MKTTAIVLVLCCTWIVLTEAAHIKSKAKLLGKLAARTKHHKRGLLSSIPPYKLGHDIPHVTHSVVKPIVVKYPPSASVTAVKVPLSPPVIRYPLPVGHSVPVPHPHYGLSFPHDGKTVAITQPDHHFHHHHHHIPVRPSVPVVPVSPQLNVVPETPLIPVGAVTEAHTVPAPPPVVVQPAAVAPAPIPLGPPPLHLIPQDHVHFKTLLPQPPLPLQPTAPFLPTSPSYPLTSPFSYLLRPGNAVQNSYFATYPRYPLLNFQTPFVPFSAGAPSAPADQLYFDRPQVPQFHLLQQATTADGAVENHLHHHQGLPIEPATSLLHPTQLSVPHPAVHIQPESSGVPIDHDGWSPVTQPHVIPGHHHLETSGFVQPQSGHHFTQEQGSQVFEHHTTNEQQYNDFQQLHHHIQQQLEQNQYEHSSNNQQLHQEYGVPQEQVQQHFGIDLTQQQQQQHDFAQHEYAQQAHNAQEYAQHAHNAQEYAQHAQNAHEYAQQAQNAHEYAQHAQNSHEYAQHAQNVHEYAQHAQNAHEYAQHTQNTHDFEQNNQFGVQQPSTQYGLPQNLGQEYGLPQQGVEGRSNEGGGDKENQQLYHNHIPLGLQLPLDRPLEHF